MQLLLAQRNRLPGLTPLAISKPVSLIWLSQRYGSVDQDVDQHEQEIQAFLSHLLIGLSHFNLPAP